MEGRVEVCHNQIWWAVSGYSYWDFRDATVVCKHLHYPANCEYYQLSNNRNNRSDYAGVSNSYFKNWSWVLDVLISAAQMIM